MNKVMQFEGDIRLSILDPVSGTKTPVNPDATDPSGNTPVEASASVFSYTAGDERKVQSKRRGRYKQTIYSDQDPGDSTFSLTLVAVPAVLLARMFYGDAANTSVSEGTFTPTSVVVTALDTDYSVGHPYLKTSPAPVVTNTGATTTYVAGVDYTIDYARGTVRALTGGAITAASTIKVNGSFRAYELTSIRGGVKPTEHFYITGDMLNRPDKSDLKLEIYDAVLSNDGDVDLFSDDPITVTLKGSLITPDDKNEPYTAKSYTPAA